MDWSLVCQYKSMRATAQVTVTVTVTLTVLQALFMAGVMFGSYTFGWLSDKFGRKPSFFIAVVIQVTHLSTALGKPSKKKSVFLLDIVQKWP